MLYWVLVHVTVAARKFIHFEFCVSYATYFKGHLDSILTLLQRKVYCKRTLILLFSPSKKVRHKPPLCILARRWKWQESSSHIHQMHILHITNKQQLYTRISCLVVGFPSPPGALDIVTIPRLNLQALVLGHTHSNPGQTRIIHKPWG